MHPSSLLSYYPTYNILDEIISINNYNTLNIFIDLKNTLQTTYMEHAIVNILENSKNVKHMDTSIFSSLISFLSFHKMYGMKRGIDLNFIVFLESGHSHYHRNISKTYKISRRIDDLYGLDRADRDRFFSILQANFKLIERACNKMPGINVIRMPNLEADFIPYYLITRKRITLNERVANVIYSNDHDLWQCTGEHSFIFSKAGKTKKIIKPGNIMSLLLKKETDIPDEYLPLAMSVIGDPGDDVDGIRGIGPATFLKIFDQLIAMTGTMEEIYDRVGKRQSIFTAIPESIWNKHLKKVVHEETTNQTISNNLKLVSFELLSRAIDNPIKTEMIEKREVIDRLYSDDREIFPLESMKKALESNGVYLEESSIDFLYI